MSDDFDGLVPFADQRFKRDELVEMAAPDDLSELLEREIRASGVVVPVSDFMELRCESEEFSAAVFMVRRAETGKLHMLIPPSLIRKPS